MKIIQFPRSQAEMLLTKEECDKFTELKDKLRRSISPGEATHYKNELDSLVARGKQRKMMKFPPSQAEISLTKEECDRFTELKDKLRRSISPGEATHYKNELDALMARGRQRKKTNK